MDDSHCTSFMHPPANKCYLIASSSGRTGKERIKGHTQDETPPTVAEYMQDRRPSGFNISEKLIVLQSIWKPSSDNCNLLLTTDVKPPFLSFFYFIFNFCQI